MQPAEGHPGGFFATSGSFMDFGFYVGFFLNSSVEWEFDRCSFSVLPVRSDVSISFGSGASAGRTHRQIQVRVVLRRVCVCLKGTGASPREKNSSFNLKRPGRNRSDDSNSPPDVVSDLTGLLFVKLLPAPLFWVAFLFVVFLLRTLLRKGWAGAVASALLLTVFAAAGTQFTLATSLLFLVFFSVAVFLLIRFGLLVLVANYVVHNVLDGFSMTIQGSAWYAGISLAGILLMAAIAFYGFYTSLGDRPVLGGAMLEE